MGYEDRVYGHYQFTEPVLLELMETAAMRRLRGIMQHGVSALIGLTSPVSRFDHSVGTLLLVKRLGGSLTEQIAALVHDVSHTAFSHVIDYVFDKHDDQSFHDEQKEKYLMQSDIPAVLMRHGYSWRDVLDDSQFTLLEQPAPRLCADRLDYFFRDCLDLQLANEQEVQEVLLQLAVVDGRIVTHSVEAARWLAMTYIAADDASWANFREVGLYELTALAIRRGIEIGAIDEDDI
ncbi:MAG: HD domain-containing protein, partial [Candidatus Promineifilaceae bacterium]|nr:HD domain-containing protein [Candidatus Promineifilaceae bacterium]